MNVARLIFDIVYGCIISIETSLQQFSLRNKELLSLFVDTLFFIVCQILNSLGRKSVMCHKAHFNQYNLIVLFSAMNNAISLRLYQRHTG